MVFKECKIKGAFVIDIERHKDTRGFFSRLFCRDEFKKHGLDFEIVQCSISYNKRKGTLRGMHYQALPFQEAKLVSCVKGSIYDVIVDMRPGSGTYRKWFSVELNDTNHRIVYIPEGVAHGFQTLEDDTTVFYQMSEFFHPEYAKGVRYDDLEFRIKWPLKDVVISDKDKSYNFLLNDVK